MVQVRPPPVTVSVAGLLLLSAAGLSIVRPVRRTVTRTSPQLRLPPSDRAPNSAGPIGQT